MTKKSAPAGATASACLSDLITIHRARLLDIIAMLDDGFVKDFSKASGAVDALKDQIAQNDLKIAHPTCGAAVRISDGYINVSAPYQTVLETALAAVRAAFEPAPVAPEATRTFDWDAVELEIEALWPSAMKADIASSLRLQHLKLQIEIAERDSYDPDTFDANNDLRLVRLQQKKLKLLAGLQKLVPPFEDHAGPSAESPEAVAAAKLAARDARKPKVSGCIEWGNGSRPQSKSMLSSSKRSNAL